MKPPDVQPAGPVTAPVTADGTVTLVPTAHPAGGVGVAIVVSIAGATVGLLLSPAALDAFLVHAQDAVRGAKSGLVVTDKMPPEGT